MSKEERVKEIWKAIKLLGWTAVALRARSPEDRAIFDELGQEFLTENKAQQDKILEKHHIKF
ncbi:unnamed protein product [marine sediment metagenome]|uniref:Uncharacterized protein n=1 Tax=marine sediment metagenome TaxID=412755 RepID=X1SXH3_9ZZZZ